MLFNIFVLGLAAVAAALPLEAEIEGRDQPVVYYNGVCSTQKQQCTLSGGQAPGGSSVWPCDSQSGKCSKSGNVCTLSSTNVPGPNNKYATGQAHCN